MESTQDIIDDLNDMADTIYDFLDGDGELDEEERESFPRRLREGRPEYPPEMDYDPDPELTSAYNRARNAYKRLLDEER